MAKEQQQVLEYLILQYIEGVASAEEEEHLFSILRSKNPDPAKLEELIEELMTGEPELATYKKEEWQKVLDQCIGQAVERKKARVVPVFIMRWAAAAAVIVLVAFGTTWLLKSTNKQAAPVSKLVPLQDVSSPVSTAAVLTLSDGKKVFLDKAPDGLVTIDGGIKLVKSDDGELVYETQQSTQSPASLSWNTITNPRGSQVVNISLSDGTKVWLNTGSSIAYPALFARNERSVEVTGEAYFEVRHDESKPFIVKSDAMQVQVLGTHFNINNYADEPSCLTTLLEGSVKISKGGQAVVLKPGQQASIQGIHNRSTDNIKVINDADLGSVIAWKNGLFDFNNEHITSIMRQLARWYNVEVVFNGKIPDRHYTGTIRKSVPLSEVIKMIELAGGVEVIINDKKMIVQEK